MRSLATPILVVVKRLLALAATASAVIALGACGSSHTRLNKAGDEPGVIHGVVTVAGGPAGASPKPPPGTVIVSRSGDDVGQETIAAGGSYRFSLPPGHITWC